MQRVDHRLELGDLAARAGRPAPRPSSRRAARRSRSCCSPSSWSGPARGRNASGTLLVHREQLDRGDAEVDEVGDGRLVAEPGVGAAQLRRDVRVRRREALDVDLVDDRVGVAGAAGRRSVVQSKAGSTTRLRGTWPAESSVLGASGSSASWPSTSGPNRDLAGDRPGVRVEQQLGRVARGPRGPGRTGRSRGTRRPGPAPTPGTKPCQTPASWSGSGIRVSAPCSSNRHSSMPSATPDATAKFVPPSRDAWRRAGTSARAAPPGQRIGRSCAGGPPAEAPGARRRWRAPLPCRRRIRSATSPVQPVWWAAPSPAPLSPWKYSLNIRLSFQAGSCLQPLDPAEARPPPVRRRPGRSRSAGRAGRRRSASSGSCWPDPVGYSTV